MQQKQRPMIKTFDTVNTKPTEKFQNEVLRPVIKLQHVLLWLNFININAKQINQLVSLNKEEQLLLIKHLFSKNSTLRNKSIGIVIGCLSRSEYNTYVNHTKEFDRRIVQMICQRIADTIPQIN